MPYVDAVVAVTVIRVLCLGWGNVSGVGGFGWFGPRSGRMG